MYRYGKARRVRPMRVKPIFLYFAVQDGLLDEEDYEKFVEAWKENGQMIHSLSANVEDIIIDDILDVDKKTLYFELGLGSTLPKRVVEASETLRTRLGG